MEAKIVLIHVDGGIPTAYTNDGSIIIAMRDEDLGKYSWDDQEELDKQEPSYEFLVSKLKEAEVVGTDDAKGRLFSPAPIDWGREYAQILGLREKAIKFLQENTERGDYSDEFCSRQDSAYLIKMAAQMQKEMAGGAA